MAWPKGKPRPKRKAKEPSVTKFSSDQNAEIAAAMVIHAVSKPQFARRRQVLHLQDKK